MAKSWNNFQGHICRSQVDCRGCWRGIYRDKNGPLMRHPHSIWTLSPQTCTVYVQAQILKARVLWMGLTCVPVSTEGEVGTLSQPSRLRSWPSQIPTLLIILVTFATYRCLLKESIKEIQHLSFLSSFVFPNLWGASIPFIRIPSSLREHVHSGSRETYLRTGLHVLGTVLEYGRLRLRQKSRPSCIQEAIDA